MIINKVLINVSSCYGSHMTPCKVRPFSTILLSGIKRKHTKAEKAKTQAPRKPIPISKSIYFRQFRNEDKPRLLTRPPPVDHEDDASMTGAASFYSDKINQDYSDNSMNIHPLESLVIEQQQFVSPSSDLHTLRPIKGKDLDRLKLDHDNQAFDETITKPTSERKLVVLMSWLEAKEKHIDKYRHFYLSRGFDVLNVKTSPFDILLPNHCAKRITNDCVRFLLEKQYKGVLYHGFSVGGFMFGQVMLNIQRQKPDIRDSLLDSIKGIVMDSLVTFEDAPKGIANSITENRMLAKTLEILIKIYLKLGRNIATKYFEEVSRFVWSGPLNCPSLFFISKDDRIVDYRSLERLADTWSDLGIETHKMVVDDSPHVQIFRNHYEAYISRVDDFLERIEML